MSNFYPKIKGLFYVVNPTPMGVGDLKSENPGVPGGGGFTILKTPGTPGVGDWDYRGVSQTLYWTQYNFMEFLILDIEGHSSI